MMNIEATEPMDNTSESTESTSSEKVKNAAGSVASAFRSVWLAALGVPLAAAESGSDLFHYLVKKGERVESRGAEHLKSASETAGRTAGKVSTTVGETIKDIGGKARNIAGKSEEAFDRKVTDILKSTGVPTKEDLQSLRERVEELSEKLDDYQSEPNNS
jgi:poly(hydroxyalkanoate) granule-associated protein